MQYEIIAITDRKLCKTDFLAQIKKLAGLPIRGIILREKDLTREEYKKMAAEILAVIKSERVLDGPVLIIHTHIEVWKEFLSGGYSIGLHLPFLLAAKKGSAWVRELTDFGVENTGGNGFMLGTSVHAPSEAKYAQELGFNYLLAGHVFETDCKMGIAGRGIDFIRQVCAETTVPVYAVGGISEENAVKVRCAGAKGVCQMSGVMKNDRFDITWLRTLGGGKDYGRS